MPRRKAKDSAAARGKARPDGPFDRVPPYAESGELNVIIETPKGARNKFKYEPDPGIFALSGILPQGAVFPFDFGFVPGTEGGDGDPLDVLVLMDEPAFAGCLVPSRLIGVLVLMDEPAFAGCLVPSRLIGVLEAEQTEEGKTERNDRLIAVAANSRNHADIRTIDALSGNIVEEIEHFFTSYNEAKGKKFKTLARRGPDQAEKIVREGMVDD